MSQQDSFQERTEQATPKRLADARRKGNVARSRELTTTVVMIAGAALLTLGGGPLSRGIVELFERSFSVPRERLLDPGYGAYFFGEAVLDVLLAVLPLFAVLAVAAFLSSIALGGWSFSVEAMSFKAERISPLKGIKRVFGVRGLVELLKALAKFLLIALAAVTWLWYLAPELLALSYENASGALMHGAAICARSLLILSLVLIVIAAIDVPFQVWHHAKNLRMTRQEVRDEQKETDGKPEVRARIRMLQQQQATRRMMEAVPKANVVITNPTHYAVAIRYDGESMAAPVVVAKGRDKVAARIREIAEEAGVVIFSAPPLARVLFRSTRIGQQIPYELYKAVAQVLAYVFQIRAWTGYGNPRPEAPTPEVDESLFPARPIDEGEEL